MQRPLRILESRSLSFVALALVIACAPRPSLSPTPVTSAFVAASPNNSTTPPRDSCWLAGRLEGTAVLRERELELLIPRGWIAVTRDNNKQWDDLHLLTEISRHPPGPQSWIPVNRGHPIVLSPTVDSAGPQLTTWESQDTLRLVVPWTPGLEPRWLIFHVDYRTVSYAKRMSTCGGTLGTDTLRFAGRTP
jgi:hypothetical protein